MVLLVALCAALAVVVYRELGGVAAPAPPAVENAGAAPRTPSASLPASGFKLPSLDSLAEVSQRPLFSSTRRPPPPEVAGDAFGPASGFALVAVIISDTGKVALIQHGRPPALSRVTEGQTVEGWAVQSISPDRVTIEHGGAQHELKLKDRTPPQPPVAPPPALAPAPPRSAGHR
jgi:type II secretory pathway component PulC